ncbi:hypothetical protein M409DRAFT_38341 [Zasmidium cellare ATCC 36951]|uniref:Carboxylic ester hydrolase n=1 Tax=Zasmidium cellare ATCC 36951 TaxID=1080233 RepID=A0A6A6BXN2_ZASCE|nr:uncharacterized protein M409DRAFT_38341 [Zasmidium cellare ATCC 36951]KAF2158312.1 hypothetical protein M409DRAFT_38341 [Zasmidium cellare ATCC 36951]
MSSGIWLAGTVLNLGLALASTPQVTLEAGIVHGAVCNGVNTSVYRGIPYAQPPVGNLRFMPPQPLNTSFPNDTLNATQFSAGCIQASDQFAWTEPSTSEDCLTLTVYTPPNNPSSLPVKVWLHGGGNTGGSASYPLYDLCHLATDSIAVAVQYRLGPLGFLALDSAGIDGNMGVKDQIAALEWVQANIGAFGGDPRKVLLFGQSSGADDAFAIASLPQTKELVRGVVCESGGGLDLAPFETMQSVGADYAVGLGCARDDLPCLQSKSVEELISTYSTLPVFSQGEGTFTNPMLAGWAAGNFPNSTNMANPYLDGKLFVQQPLAVGPQVPIILGSNTNDGSLFAVPPLLGDSITPQNYTTFLSQFGPLAPAIQRKYPLPPNATQTAIIAALTNIETLFAFKCFAYRGLRSAKNSGVQAYAYSFDHKLSCPWLWEDGTPFPTGAETELFSQPMHTAELTLVLGGLENLPWGNGSCDLSAREAGLSEVLRKSWTAMAVSGDPSLVNLSWTPFDKCDTQGLYIGNSTVVRKLDFSECEFWDEVQHELGGLETSWPSCEGNATNVSNASVPAPYTSGQGSSRSVAIGGLVVGGLIASFLQVSV